MRTATTWARWFCCGLLFALLVGHVADAGGFELSPPATVFSRAFAAQRAHEPLLLLLQEVRDRVPPGASVVVLAEGDRREIYFLALSQLPRQDVWMAPEGNPRRFRTGLPEFVVTLRRPLRHPDYRLAARLEGGRLYRRRR